MTTSISENLASVRSRIEAACRRVGRSPDDVTLVAVSKTHPAERVARAAEAGITVVGENRVQEALTKAPEVPHPLEWHLIGPLQTNKIRPALRLFRTFHAVDREKVARGLDREAAKIGVTIDGFLEVNLGGEPSKHGFEPAELRTGSIDALAELPHLVVRGLMAIPPWETDLAAARGWFVRLRELRDEVFAREAWHGRPGWLSMGMSHDFESAIEEGATHVRVGTAIFGPRG